MIRHADTFRTSKEDTMAIGFILQFDKVGQDKYEAVMKELGLKLNSNGNWPEGILSHVAGKSEMGMCVVDVWESEEAFRRFRESKLGPAFAKVGGLPEPKITAFQVFNKFPR
jgi:heme-degrading monooxygenase HmoA